MSLIQLAGPGITFPSWASLALNKSSSVQFPFVQGGNSGQLIDATGEKFAFVGELYIYGSPAGTKTISAGGGGKIHFLPGTITFANIGTLITIGIQDVSASGPPMQPDGTDDVSFTLVPGVDTVTADTWFSKAPALGTKDMAHGDKFSVVATMTTRAGADAFRMSMVLGSPTWVIPFGTQNLGSWAGGIGPSGWIPICLIEFDDGTLGTFAGGLPISATGVEAFADATNPDERGLVFQVQTPCKIDRIYASLGASAATADGTMTIYSDPLGTPSSVYSINYTAEQLGTNDSDARQFSHQIPSGSEPTLAINTDYCIAFKATGAGSVVLGMMTFNNSAYRRFISNGLNIRKGTRNNGSGAFTEDTTKIPSIWMDMAYLSDTAGSGGGSTGMLFRPQGTIS